MIHRLCLLFAACCLYFLPAMAEETAVPEIGNIAKVYKGPEQMTVSLLRFGPKEASEALVMLEGIDHPWNGKVFKTSISPDGSNYSMMVNHNPNYVIVALRTSYQEPKISTAFISLEDDKNQYQATYDERLSREAKPAEMLAKYLGQNKQ